MGMGKPRTTATQCPDNGESGRTGATTKSHTERTIAPTTTWSERRILSNTIDILSSTIEMRRILCRLLPPPPTAPPSEPEAKAAWPDVETIIFGGCDDCNGYGPEEEQSDDWFKALLSGLACPLSLGL